MKFGNDKPSVAAKIIQHINSMRKTSQPVEGAPKREVMPQTDNAMDEIINKTSVGKLDVLKPISPQGNNTPQ